MDCSEIDYEIRGAAAWIRLNRPNELNALSPGLIGEFSHALSEAEADARVACVIITGSGRAFCAGADLKFVNDLPADRRASATSAFLQAATDLMSRIEALSKPVVAAVNGIATAGGMEIILACDLVVAAQSARLGDGHANFGLLPGAGASLRLPRKIGMNRAKYLFFTGDLLPAGDAIFHELVNRVVPDAELEHAIDSLAAQIASKSSLGLRRMKALANSALDHAPEQALRLEQIVNEGHTLSHDRNEGLSAFNERRKPVFLGR
jgi:enoyl-CoA hydratase